MSSTLRTLTVLCLCSSLIGCDNPPATDAGVDGGSDPVDAGPLVDAGPIGTDAGPLQDAGPPVDAGPLPDSGLPADAGPTGGGIQDARGAADAGAVVVPITAAFVTYLRPEIGAEAPGFFVQEVASGPAIFVAIDPASLTPAVEVGQLVDFTVTEVVTVQGHVEVSAIEAGSWNVISDGNDIDAVVQDVSSTDLVAMLDAHSAELVRLTNVTLAGPFTSCGSPSTCAQITNAGVTAAMNSFRFRVPFDIVDTLDLREGCVIDVGPTPLWRFNDDAQPSAWVEADLSVVSCPNAPAPTVAGELLVTEIHAASVMSDDFVELLNTTAGPFDLGGCNLRDVGNSLSQTIAAGNIVLPGQRIVIGGAAAMTPTAIALGYDLAASGAVELFCGGTVIDGVDYSAAGFPVGLSDASIQSDTTVLSDAAPSTSNDDGSRWCVSPDSVVFGTANRRGTPGSENAMCPRTCSSTADHVVVNELNYDDDSNDGHEFVELFNPTASAVDLSAYDLVLFNGNDREEYRRLTLSGTIAPGGFVVISSTASDVPGTDGLAFGGALQNGAPDGIAILEGTTVIDFVSYEGAFSTDELLAPGGGSTLTTIPSGLNVSIGGDPGATQTDSISRVIDGCDSGDPRADWIAVDPMTPGATNEL